MPTVMPKISDIKTLMDLSKVIVLPLIIASYILDTGMNADLGWRIITIPTDSSLITAIFGSIFIFILKALFVSCFAVFLYVVLVYAHFYLMCARINLFVTLALLFISFGFYGLFADGSESVFGLLHGSWLYTSFGVGFFMLRVSDDIDDAGIPTWFSIRH